MSSRFDTIDPTDLARTCGGVQMQVTQYGYPHDPDGDSQTRAGHGAYHDLAANRSVALTDSGLRALGLSRSQVRGGSEWVNINLRGGGTLHRRIDDRAPEANKRVDVYQPGGFDRHLAGSADVSLAR
ncbi:MAG TPA: hypothetical protein VGF94_18030 [Kofleriaceae bacterium]|jgi:hypothetical protein